MVDFGSGDINCRKVLTVKWEKLKRWELQFLILEGCNKPGSYLFNDNISVGITLWHIAYTSIWLHLSSGTIFLHKQFKQTIVCCII